MERTIFKITINASPETVWDVLWGDTTYSQWTTVFAEGSKAVTDWKEGSKVLFLDANNEGMISSVAKRIDNTYMSFKHWGMIDKDGNEDLTSDNVKAWAGSEENYTLKAIGSQTELLVEFDMDDSHKDYFMDTWPKALDLLKTISEKTQH